MIMNVSKLRRITSGCRLCAALTAGFLFYAALQQADAAADRCAAPEDLTANISPLPHVAAMLKPGGTLRVLTVGSATVFSPMAQLQSGTVTAQSLGVTDARPPSDPLAVSEAAFPVQMARALEVANPGLKVEVTVRGGRGMTAVDMLEIIRTELAAQRYQLVIWQTGTVEAVRNIPAGSFFQTMSDGTALINEAGSDLVLVDPQYSRFLHANADLDPYEQTMASVAAQPGVILFHRFDLMRYWATEGQIDLERTPKPQRVDVVEALHACLGQALAHMVTAASKEQS